MNNKAHIYIRLSKYCLALVTGIILFTPQLLSLISEAYIFNFIFYIFWTLALIALLSSGIALYNSDLRQKVPLRSGGIGFWTSLLSILCLVIFLTANFVNDRKSLPIIKQIHYEPVVPFLSNIYKLHAEVFDRDNDTIRYKWYYKGKIFSQEKTAYWRASKKQGSYRIRLDIEDDNKKPISKEVIIMVYNNEKLLFLRDLINFAISRLPKVKIEETKKIVEVLLGGKFEFDDPFREWLVKELDDVILSDETLKTHPLLINQAFLKLISEINEAENEYIIAFFSRDKLPPCSKFPGFWPFCDPKR